MPGGLLPPSGPPAVLSVRGWCGGALSLRRWAGCVCVCVCVRACVRWPAHGRPGAACEWACPPSSARASSRCPHKRLLVAASADSFSNPAVRRGLSVNRKEDGLGASGINTVDAASVLAAVPLAPSDTCNSRRDVWPRRLVSCAGWMALAWQRPIHQRQAIANSPYRDCGFSPSTADVRLRSPSTVPANLSQHSSGHDRRIVGFLASSLLSRSKWASRCAPFGS
eukprot:scaffold7390_cov420-Prasinococcus_capsulatus_cf.AAC.4